MARKYAADYTVISGLLTLHGNHTQLRDNL